MIGTIGRRLQMHEYEQDGNNKIPTNIPETAAEPLNFLVYSTGVPCCKHLHLKPKFLGQALVLPHNPLRLPPQAAMRLDLGLAPNILNHSL